MTDLEETPLPSEEMTSPDELPLPSEEMTGPDESWLHLGEMTGQEESPLHLGGMTPRPLTLSGAMRLNGARMEDEPGPLLGPALIRSSSMEPPLPLDEEPPLASGEIPRWLLAAALIGSTVVDQTMIPIPDEIVEGNATSEGEIPVNGGADRHSGTAAAGGQKVPICHEVMKYMIPCLVFFAKLMYQGKPGALLAENPVAVSCFLLSYCVYWLIVRKMKEMPSDSSETRRFRILNQVAFVCGLVSGASPLFILLINHHKLPLLHHLFWMLLAVGFLWLLLFCAYVYLFVGDAIQEGGQPELNP